MNLHIWNVVELSKPVDISSINKAFAGPTSISPTHIFPILLIKIYAQNCKKNIQKMKNEHILNL